MSTKAEKIKGITRKRFKDAGDFVRRQGCD